MNIKGIIIAIGGNEDKGTNKKPLHERDAILSYATDGILFRILSELKNPEATIEVITSASSIPEQLGKRYIKAFKKLGHKKVGVLHLESHSEADNPTVLNRISNAGCIMFTGGDQFKLTCILKDTALVKLIHERYIKDEVVIAGTSAGAMAMPDLMIYPGNKPINVHSQDVPLFEGLSLVHDAIIDTHFLVRGRFRRLAVATSIKPDHIGIGLEEDTGIIIREGNKIETIGSGLVTILDSRNIQRANPSVKKEKHEIFIENMLVHVLCNGNHFTLNRKKIT